MRLYNWCSNAMMLVMSVIMIVLLMILMINSPPANFRSYDCSMAEFHPDYPVKVKQACREQLRQQYLKENTK